MAISVLVLLIIKISLSSVQVTPIFLDTSVNTSSNVNAATECSLQVEIKT